MLLHFCFTFSCPHTINGVPIFVWTDYRFITIYAREIAHEPMFIRLHSKCKLNCAQIYVETFTEQLLWVGLNNFCQQNRIIKPYRNLIVNLNLLFMKIKYCFNYTILALSIHISLVRHNIMCSKLPFILSDCFCLIFCSDYKWFLCIFHFRVQLCHFE